MPSVDWPVANDASTVGSGGWDYGNTVDQHHPVGLWSSHLYRAFLKFTLTNLADMVSITSATLHMRSTTQVHAAFGSDPDIYARRLTSSLANTQGGSAEGTWSGSASPKRSTEPSSTDTGRTTADMTTTESTWDTIDVTAIAQAWLAGSTNYGISIRAVDETTTADTWEFYSRDSTSDPYITVVYVDNRVPNAPTGLSPTSLARIAGVDPTIAFTHSDPDGDPIGAWDLQVSTDSTFASVTHLDLNDKTLGIIGAGPNVSNSYETLRSTYGVGTALTRGVTYYWRARTSSQAGTAGDGAWTAAQSFHTNALPTATLTDPATTGYLGHMAFTPGSGQTTPRLQVAWTMSDADSDTQTKYQVVITESTTAGGTYSAFYDSGQVTSAAQTLDVPATFVEGRYYKTYVLVYDGYEWSTAHQDIIVRARWATATHRKDVSISGAAPTSWSVTSLVTTTGATSSVVIEYNSSDDGTTNLGAWKSDLAAVTKRKYVHFRVWLMCWGSATPTSPSLDAITISCSGLALTADFWLPQPHSSVGGSIDISAHTFGSQSMRLDGNGTTRTVYQQISVEPNVDYVLQARIKSIGNSGATVVLSDSNTGSAPLLQIGPVSADQDWATATSASYWNAGSRTSVYVCVQITGAASTAGLFDGLKVERGRVASPWVPGLVGDATTVDAGGLQVDASAGGVFRLRGSTGGTRDIVELGTHGLKLGGDTEVYSDSAGQMKVAPAGSSYAQSLLSAIRLYKRRLLR